MNIFVCFDVDGLRRGQVKSALAEDVEAIRRQSFSVDRANENFKSFVLTAGGTLISLGGSQGKAEIPADKVSELEQIRSDYSGLVGETVSMGLGTKISEAEKSLIAAKLRGGDKIVFYGEDVDKTLQDTEGKPEAKEVTDEYFGKKESPFDGLAKADYWGKRAAGVIIRAPSGKVLMLHRSNDVFDPNQWGVPGGRVDRGHGVDQTVRKEAAEELGGLPRGFTVAANQNPHVFKAPDADFQYHTYLADVPEEFTPQLNWEHTGHEWVDPLEVMSGNIKGIPVHHNVVAALKHHLGVKKSEGLTTEAEEHLRRDHYEEKREGMKDPARYHVKKVGELGDYEIWLVDGEAIRNTEDIDFTSDANPGRYSYTPLNEIWIDEYLSPLDQMATALHAFVEVEDMKDNGTSYDKAHNAASDEEIKFREENEGTEKLDLETVKKWLGKKLNKAEGFDSPVAPERPVAQTAQQPSTVQQPEPPKSVEDQFHEHAQGQEAQDQQDKLNSLQSSKALKAKVVGILQQVKQQAPVFEQLKTQAPVIYQSLTAMVQAIIAMAKELPKEEPVQKSEPQSMFEGLFKATKKAYRAPHKPITLVHFGVVPCLSMIDTSHMGTGAKSQEYRQGVPDIGRAHYYRANSPVEHLIVTGAKAKYATQIDPIKQPLYDLAADEEGLVEKGRMSFAETGDFESPVEAALHHVKSAGYHGFYNSQGPLSGVVAMFYPQKVQEVPFTPDSKTPKLKKNVTEFLGGRFGDGEHEWSVPRLYWHAKKLGTQPQKVPIEHLKHNFEGLDEITGQPSEEHFKSPEFQGRAATSEDRPIFVVKYPGNKLHIADGFHRTNKAMKSGQTHMNAIVIDHTQLPPPDYKVPKEGYVHVGTPPLGVKKSESEIQNNSDNDQEHSLPGSLGAEGYRAHVHLKSPTTIVTIHRNGQVVGRMDGNGKAEWNGGVPERVGLDLAAKSLIDTHLRGLPQKDGWNEAESLTGLKKTATTKTVFAKAEGPVQGSAITAPAPTYDIATQSKGPHKNLWARDASTPSNKSRTLMVQFSSDLLKPQGVPKTNLDQSYDKLYSQRAGYHRPQDFWEVPQWVSHLAHSVPESDFYTVRDPAEAIKFFNEAGYKNLAFSSLDVNKDHIRSIAQNYPGHIAIGGYTDTSHFQGLPNVTVHPTMRSFVESEGRQYIPGYDYRHFAGTKTIPRLTLSDGCRHKCSYCTIPKKIEEKSRDEVMQQLESFAKHLPSDLIYLNDKTFGQAKNHEMLPEIYDRIKAANPDFKGFIIQTTAAQMGRFTPDFLKRSGIKHVELGVESFNDPILKAHKKPANEKIIQDAADKIRAMGGSLIPNIMVGLPGEDQNSYKHTLEWLDKNKDIISHVNSSNIAVYNNTDLSNQLKDLVEGDRDQNVVGKSWQDDPRVHQQFSDSLALFNHQQLDNQAMNKAELESKVEPTPEEVPPKGKTLKKRIVLPGGSTKTCGSTAVPGNNPGSIKTLGGEGKWREVRAGMVLDADGINPISTKSHNRKQ